ncbi:leader peptidase (prepilin peptidase)/N-methyltransferase [Isoptericola sp. CG 20/1183]|uniref:Leader peptidase (Prepilin peptidase)/N-methyltransferase n=1 Tax=Isoptericola halotolerans TaxID=300560 RepID=A0ABX5EJB5_9MICO|nr:MULTISPECIES: A24 family peptidase [Isoptericola]PRZ09704.1 leader peptidase (prepilin peptidase)/N-methyltransferase [Isoptericola sp. CG 20/1183]PRZ10505.1 leader peptidase (prepilin peptidase)/N-methyltransferase [Isoptericola halotolerans]
MPTLAERAALEVAPFRRRIAVGGVLAVVWAVWASGPGWSTPALAVAAVAGVALGVVDAATHRLPDAVTYPTTAVVGLLLAGAALAGDAGDAGMRALAGALCLGGGYLLLHLASPSGLGLGDVKLAVLLGLVSGWYGWPVLWAAAVLPFLLGGVAALVLIGARRATRRTAIAFGPCMLAGTALALTAARLAAA